MFHVCHADPGSSRAHRVSTQPCPPGQLFNQGLGSCDTEELVECELLASADQGFGGVARRARRSLAVLVDVVQDAVGEVRGERTRRARRAAPQDSPLEFYYADYDAAVPVSGRRADTHTDGFPRALAAGDEQQEYFRYSDAVATVGTPLTTTTARQFNPDDYVDDNYEPLIEPQGVDSKPSSLLPEKHPGPATAVPPVTALTTASAFVDDDRGESVERHAPFSVASLRADDTHQPVVYASDLASPRPQPTPSTGIDKDAVAVTSVPQVVSDKPPATLPSPPDAGPSKSSTTGLVTPNNNLLDSDTPTTTPSMASTTPTAASASGAHRFRVGEKQEETLDPRHVPSTTTLPSSPSTAGEGRRPLGQQEAAVAASAPPPPRRPHKKSQPQRFVCSGRELKAFHADPADCRLFHYCSPGFSRAQLLDFRFRCEEGTVYQRATHRCEPGQCPSAQ